jgi:hypothetical protein
MYEYFFGERHCIVLYCTWRNRMNYDMTITHTDLDVQVLPAAEGRGCFQMQGKLLRLSLFEISTSEGLLTSIYSPPYIIL